MLQHTNLLHPCLRQDAKQSVEALQQATQEEQQRKSKGRKKGRIRELEEIRSELAEKELVLLGKEQELLDKDQTVEVLRKEVPLFSHTPFGHHLAVPHADTLLPIRCTSSWHSRHCRRHAIAAVAVALLRHCDLATRHGCL